MNYRFLRYPDGKAKAVTFSYDDACRSDLRLVEVCNKHGIKCTFNLNSRFLAKNPGESHLTPAEVQQYLLDAGHEIAVHGQLHRAPGACRPIDTIQDVLNCRLELEETFGIIIRGMAYPDSGITVFNNTASYENIRQSLISLDIAYSRTLAGDNNGFHLPTDWYAWMPTVHHNNPKALEYADEFLSFDASTAYCSNRWPRLYYLWGHSFEFDNNQNWELLDALCEKLGGKADVWYATNMEIYDYVQAYNSLIFSADSTQIHNPTRTTLWFDQGGTLYRIAPGETLRII